MIKSILKVLSFYRFLLVFFLLFIWLQDMMFWISLKNIGCQSVSNSLYS